MLSSTYFPLSSFRVYTRETKITTIHQEKNTHDVNMHFQLSKRKCLHNKSIVEASKHLQTGKGINNNGKA